MNGRDESMGRAGEELVRALVAGGELVPEWEEAFRRAPRGAFVPELVWAYDMGSGRSVGVSRRQDPEGWERAVYTNVPLVTQWDDGAREEPGPGSVATSSASMPSVVAGMLRDLDVRDGARVLEVGTGTGWNAGLLAHRLGDRNVVSVEVDADVAGRAREALGRANLAPQVVHGDGVQGCADRAPYDRVIVTAGVREVPGAWLAQTRPGGIVLAPWGTYYSDQDALVRLRVAEDGSASGPFLRMVEFMKLREQRLDWGRFREYVTDFPEGSQQSGTDVELAELGGRYESVRFVLGLCVPDCAHVVNAGAGRPGGAGDRAWFFDLRSTSWAAVEWPGGVVRQYGPRRLWDEVEGALTWWHERGRPGVERFGLTVGTDGNGQRVWWDEPGHTVPPDQGGM
ncbi:methyltransferase domain-containing protein [Streptomyces sp. NPDC048442]|uniref:methyltransferase domain-containing protein n=1 Tax=Streptomyces sp. NPDC048442 TaxID=3154823 RepID=UPI0034124C71